MNLPSEIGVDKRHLTMLEGHPPVTNGELVPREVCEQVISWGKTNMVPCGLRRASEMAQVLIGAYPKMNAHDPVTYAKSLVGVISERPEIIAQEGIKKLIRTLKFLPTSADLVESFDECARRIAAVIFNANAHIRENDRRMEERRRLELIRKEALDMRIIMGDEAYEALMSLPILRRYAGSSEQFAEGFNEAEDKDAFLENWGKPDDDNRLESYGADDDE